MITNLGLPGILCPQKYVDNGGGFANKSWQALFSNAALIKRSDASNTCLNRNLKFHPLPPTSGEGEDFLAITKARTWNRKYFRLSKWKKKKAAAGHGETWGRWQPDGLKPALANPARVLQEGCHVTRPRLGDLVLTRCSNAGLFNSSGWGDRGQNRQSLPGLARAAPVEERHTKSCLFSLPKASAVIAKAGQQSRLWQTFHQGAVPDAAAGSCVKELRELPCQDRVHALVRAHYPPGKAQVGARDSRFWQKPSMQRLRKATCAPTTDPSTPMSLPKKRFFPLATQAWEYQSAHILHGSW